MTIATDKGLQQGLSMEKGLSENGNEYIVSYEIEYFLHHSGSRTQSSPHLLVVQQLRDYHIHTSGDYFLSDPFV